MKKSISLLAWIMIAFCSYSQQDFTDFQDASMVIGQPDFKSQVLNLSDSITITPSCIAISSQGMLAVAEQRGGSIKIWYELPEYDGQPADVEVGNPDFNTSDPGPSEYYSSSFDGVAWSPDGNKLLASCGMQNRVLVWNSIPEKNGQPADVVIGQKDFILTDPSTKKDILSYPAGITVTPDGRLLIADMNNNRVMIWNSIPETNGDEADVVIGQTTFNDNIAGADANRLDRPHGVHLAPNGQLLVTNVLSHQVFVFDSIPVSDAESATLVIGHEEFGNSSSGTSDSTMNMPYSAIITHDGKLAEAEFGNNRILIFNSSPEKSGANANVVLGQQDFYSNTIFAPSGFPGKNNFSGLSDITKDLNGRLWVAGRSMNRIMVFGDIPKQSADLEIRMTQSDSVLCEMSDILYKIDVFNAGPDTAFNVVATAAFPLGYTFDNSFTSNGSYTRRSGYWQIASIAPKESASLIIDGFVNKGMKLESSTSYASIIGSSATDYNLRNNGTSTELTIQSIKLPDDPIVYDTYTCEGDKAMLFADGSGTIEWYTVENCFTPIAKGLTYSTGPLTESITYYAKTHDVCPGNTRVPVQVDVTPTYNASEIVYVCYGSSYTYPDGTVQNNITSPVKHVSNLYTKSNCDSTIITAVMINPVYEATEAVTICSGENFTFPDGTSYNNITVPVVYTSNLISMDGCDSIIVTTLDIHPVYNGSEEATICSGDSYTFPDGITQENIINSLSYSSHFISQNNCDSIIVTELTVLPSYNVSEFATVCAGESYTFPDGTTENDITSSMVYTSNMLTKLGCDSIMVTTLSVVSGYNLSETVEVCSGNSYTFPDGSTENNMLVPVSYTSNLTTAGGCDSIITTHVMVNSVDVSVYQEASTLIANTSTGEYQWIDCHDGNNSIAGETGESFTSSLSGSYAVIISENGCTDTSDCYTIAFTGIEEGMGKDVMIYPNPVKDKLTIHLPDCNNPVGVSVIDLYGQIVFDQVFAYKQNLIELDLQHLSSGIYLIHLNTENTDTVFRILME